MKVVGPPPPFEERWKRFSRMQRTADLLMGGLPYPRGVHRFISMEEADQWQMNQRLARHARQKTAT